MNKHLSKTEAARLKFLMEKYGFHDCFYSGWFNDIIMINYN
jgi:hypothetical protein